MERAIMNGKPIEQAQDRDIRLSQVALQRAAQRAHDVARATGTTVVVSNNGVIEHRQPEPRAMAK
jgi:hypothetical protein